MKKKLDISKLKGILGNMQEWLGKSHFPSFLLFLFMGFISTVWFLIRVIPKPSRATYPCMRVAAPFMSGFVIYLLSLGGTTLLFRKAKKMFFQSRYILAVAFFMLSISGALFLFGYNSTDSLASGLNKSGPKDGPNQPMGKGWGIHPGRVVWVWNPKATNENCINAFDFYKPENTNQGVVNKMVVDGITHLSGKQNLKDSWEAIFRYFNSKKGRGDKSYSRGEKIFIKINQGTANGKLKSKDIKNGFYIPEKMTQSEDAKKGLTGTCETYPNVVLEILRELVYVVGVDQKNIAIGDPISHIFGHNYNIWATEFPDVIYVDHESSDFGRTLIHPTKKDLVFYSDKKQSDKLYDIIEDADYLINVANLKPHGRAGISLTAKNHFGSHARKSAFHLHYSLISPVSLGKPTNNGYQKYRVQVDLMGSKYLGRNTLLYIVDGLYGGGSNETKVPVKYFMAPFNNDWCNSIFLSQDQVALESVCYDFIRTEWNGTVKHNPANNAYEYMPNVFGVDDYLHQAADSVNWPDGILYDPDNSGQPLPSLGVHEHWNNPVSKQYTNNLGGTRGIELIAVPDSLVGKKGSQIYGDSGLLKKETEKSGDAGAVNTTESFKTKKKGSKNVLKTTWIGKNFNGQINATNFYSLVIDDNNIKWFLTEKGIVSYDGTTWKLHKEKVLQSGLKDVVYNFSGGNKELWLATPQGAIVASVPMDIITEEKTYVPQDSAIISNNVVSIAVGRNSVYWFGADNGIAAFKDGKWLHNSYSNRYSKELFKMFPITDIATNPRGDTLYIAMEGAGISRVYINDVDAVSGASEYVQWGPIKIPSDNIYCIYIARDGTQWFGTDAGVARHIGGKTLENWTVFTTADGLVNNFVQAIVKDRKGEIWLATKGGVTVYDGTSMTSFTKKEGLASDNVKCLAIDKDGVLWFGTDMGVTNYVDGVITTYSTIN